MTTETEKTEEYRYDRWQKKGESTEDKEMDKTVREEKDRTINRKEKF